ncbi:MAG TPA: hypothetical protein VN660_12900 [Steroidobacteraceae bacterium]|nr:hypothetical protein [Steroidobacteraceae bacterium]
MSNEAGEVRILGEVHCYFPEWADRSDSAGQMHEADRNSYLAGGYAEEFGYHSRPDNPPAFPPFRGDPEHSQEWSVQLGCLHPGYPECPQPIDRDNRGRVTDSGARDQIITFPSLDAANRTTGVARHAGVTHVVPVNRDATDHHSGLLRPLSSFLARLLIRSGVRDHRI